MDLEGQRRLQSKPCGMRLMRQRWRDLLFLHWEVKPEVIAATLPPGLEPDCFEGRAYLGVVPFFMEGVRLAGCPPIPGISSFLECNVRTYVVGPRGPGVWFYSLDCNQPLAVECARTFFKLSYFHARMEARQEEGGIVYTTMRKDSVSERKQRAPSVFIYRGKGAPRPAEPGSFEFFLLERYQLYAADFGRERLFSGRVWHQPYQWEDVQCPTYDSLLAEVAGFASIEGEFNHACTCRGVEVTIYPLSACK